MFKRGGKGGVNERGREEKREGKGNIRLKMVWKEEEEERKKKMLKKERMERVMKKQKRKERREV